MHDISVVPQSGAPTTIEVDERGTLAPVERSEIEALKILRAESTSEESERSDVSTSHRDVRE